MQALAASFKTITDEYQKLIIPFYQRSYVWSEVDWSKFYEDLYHSMESNKDHFLGSILIKKTDKEYGYVVDGQQRLTTFSLLLRTLYTIQLKDRWSRKGTLPTLWTFPNEDAIPKIEHSHLDSEQFEMIIDYERVNSLEEDKHSSNMIKCYNYFEKQINELSEDNQKKLFDYLVSKNLFVHITIESSEDEQKIFDSINTTGQPLTVTDIIKNALFHQLLILESTSKDKINKFYQKYWQSIFEHTPEQSKFWNTQHTIGRYKRYRSELLLNGFAICEGILKDTDNFNDLGMRFKNEFKKMSKDELLIILQKIHSYAEDFVSWDLFKNKSEFNYQENSIEDRLFHYLNISPTTTVYPILMFLRNRIKDITLYNSCIQLLESYIIRRSVLNYTDKGYNKVFFRLIDKLRNVSPDKIYETLSQELKNFKTDSDFFPNNEQLLKLCNYDIDRAKAKFILYWIAIFMDDTKSERTKLIYDKKLTIEHLMPQKWETHWSANLTLEQKEKREKLIQTIGNLSLLSDKLNSSLQNREWSVKIHGNDQYKGIAELSILNLNKNLSDGGLLNYQIWNETEIEKRSSRITDMIKQIWIYPQ